MVTTRNLMEGNGLISVTKNGC